MQPQKLKEILLEDWEFFSLYREKFIRNITEEITLKEEELDQAAFGKFLNLCEDIYEALFNLETEIKAIYPLFQELLRQYERYAKYLINALAYLAAEYVNFVVNRELNINKVYAIFTLYSFVFFTLRKAYENLKLQKEGDQSQSANLAKIKETLLEELKKVAEKLGVTDEKVVKELALSVIDEILRAYGKLPLNELKEKAVQKFREKLIKKKLEEVKRIFYYLKRIKEEDNKVELRTYYKELPVICVGSISSLDPEANIVILEAKLCKFKIFYQVGQEIYINHPILPVSLKGKVLKGEPAKGTIVVSDLRMEEDKFANRKYVRIELEHPVNAEIYTKTNKYYGIIKDISQRGVAIKFDELPPVSKDNMVKLRMFLDGLEIETLAVVRRIDKDKKIIGLEFQLPYLEEKRLIQYILQQQQEILNTLKL